MRKVEIIELNRIKLHVDMRTGQFLERTLMKYWFGYYNSLGNICAVRWCSDSVPSPNMVWVTEITEAQFKLPIVELMVAYPKPEPPS